MPADGSDRALRRLVAQLAKAGPADIDAVFDMLDPSERLQARALLDAYLQPQPSPDPPVRSLSPPPHRIDGLSPWLEARLEQRSPTSPPAEAGMTPAAAAALHESARALMDTGRLTPHAPPPPPRPSLLGRLRATVFGSVA